MATLIWLTISIVAGWLINLLADTLPERRSIRKAWRWPFAHVNKTLWDRWVAVDNTQPPVRRPWRHLIVWLIAPVFAWLSYRQMDWYPESLIITLYAWFFLTIAVIDLEHRLVLNRMLFPALPAIILLNAIIAPFNLVSALLGAAVGFGLFLLLAIISPGSMGMGDVKLAGVIGLSTGIPGILVAIMVCILSGGLAALAILLWNRFQHNQTMAYAPYLVLGAWAAIYFGTDLWHFYMELL